MIADGISNNIHPNLVQPFLPSVAKFSFSFDFYLAAVSDSPWKIRIGDGATANLEFFINSANSFEFAGATRGTVASLTGGTWYQLDAIVNDTTQTFSASLVPSGGVPLPFSGSLYLDGPKRTGRVEIMDASSNQNPTLTIDNFSVRGIPEPSTFGFLVCSFSLLVGCRQRLKIIRPILPFRVSL